MKITSIILSAIVLISLHFSCGESNEKETIDNTEEVVKEIPADKIKKTSTETLCDAPFKIEGTNDAKGEYKLGNNESWTIHFSDSEQDFVAFYTEDGKQDQAMVIEKIVKMTDCEFKIVMEGIGGEIVPTWVLKYNSANKFYDLYVHNYHAETDTWTDDVFSGSADNG